MALSSWLRKHWIIGACSAFIGIHLVLYALQRTAKSNARMEAKHSKLKPSGSSS
uniref:uncharacterized protein n=1 Tax=Myxine glutinosa TaxID=7769 RepID=UPI00358E9949